MTPGLRRLRTVLMSLVGADGVGSRRGSAGGRARPGGHRSGPRGAWAVLVSAVHDGVGSRRGAGGAHPVSAGRRRRLRRAGIASAVGADGVRLRRGTGPVGAGPGRRRGTERGAGTVLVLSVVMVTLVVAQAVAVLAAGQMARHRAAAAADLAALAAAQRLAFGALDPCADAGRIARANGATLRDCLIDGVEVEVQVRVETTSALPWLPAQDRRARAGPPRPG